MPVAVTQPLLPSTINPRLRSNSRAAEYAMPSRIPMSSEQLSPPKSRENTDIGMYTGRARVNPNKTRRAELKGSPSVDWPFSPGARRAVVYSKTPHTSTLHSIDPQITIAWSFREIRGRSTDPSRRATRHPALNVVPISGGTESWTSNVWSIKVGIQASHSNRAVIMASANAMSQNRGSRTKRWTSLHTDGPARPPVTPTPSGAAGSLSGPSNRTDSSSPSFPFSPGHTGGRPTCTGLSRSRQATTTATPTPTPPHVQRTSRQPYPANCIRREMKSPVRMEPDRLAMDVMLHILAYCRGSNQLYISLAIDGHPMA
mmetsp:Transcript_14705/g.41832  ORF Transcript_14705/g.41832 Transcript_14705/m.41832 type:complete len:315 (-) Transcript_14705:176-1120(-)